MEDSHNSLEKTKKLGTWEIPADVASKLVLLIIVNIITSDRLIKGDVVSSRAFPFPKNPSILSSYSLCVADIITLFIFDNNFMWIYIYIR